MQNRLIEQSFSAALTGLEIFVGHEPKAALCLPWAIIFRSDRALN